MMWNDQHNSVTEKSNEVFGFQVIGKFINYNNYRRIFDGEIKLQTWTWPRVYKNTNGNMMHDADGLVRLVAPSDK